MAAPVFCRMGSSRSHEPLQREQGFHFKEAVEQAAALHAHDELFSKHIKAEPAPEDPVDWAMAEASDDEDDAPMPDAPPEPELIDMPPAPVFLLSHVSVVPCVLVLCVLPRLPDSDKKVSFFFAMASRSVETR